jgi:hypothetical protein
LGNPLGDAVPAAAEPGKTQSFEAPAQSSDSLFAPLSRVAT